VCDRATALDPEKRHGSAAELAYDIERCLQARSRRAGKRELAALVGEVFQDERQAMRARIERELGGSDADPTRDLAPRAASALMTGAEPSALVSEPISHSQLYSMDLPTTGSGLPWSQRKKLAVAGGGAGAVALLGGLLLAMTGGSQAPTSTTSRIEKQPARVDVARAPERPAPAAVGVAGTDDTTLARTAGTPTTTLGLTDTGVTGTGASLAKLERSEPPRKNDNRQDSKNGAHHRRSQPVAAAIDLPPAASPPPSEAPAARPTVVPPPVATDVASRTERSAPASAVPSERNRRGAQPGDDLARSSRSRGPNRRQLDEQDPHK
jgi:hypothetical protein